MNIYKPNSRVNLYFPHTDPIPMRRLCGCVGTRGRHQATCPRTKPKETTGKSSRRQSSPEVLVTNLPEIRDEEKEEARGS